MDSTMESPVASTSNSNQIPIDSTSTTTNSTTNSTSTASTSNNDLPTGGYTDYILRSSDPSHSWRYNIMKFGVIGDKVVSPESFVKPVKLNRKDPRTVRRLTDAERDKMNLQAAESGVIKEVVGYVKLEPGQEGYKPFFKREKEEMDLSLVGQGTSSKKPVVRNKDTMFKKKIKRVFVSSEEARRLKREEWMPWVLEDNDGNERWIGRLEGGTGESSTNTLAGSAGALKKSAEADKNGTGMTGWRPSASASEAGGGGSSYVAFVFGKGGDDFKVVPANRWYKFSRGPRHATLGTEEAEEEYNRLQKSQEPERWMMHKRVAPTIPVSADGSTSTPTPGSLGRGKLKLSSKIAPAPSNIRSRILDKSVLSLPQFDSGKPKLRSVIKGSSGGNGDDELRGRKSRGDGGRGQEQEDDEFDYEEDFQDDEEGIAKIDDLADEGETREVADRIKKEMRGANRFDMAVDDDEDDDEFSLTNTGKELKKLVKKGDKEGAYESDDDDAFHNPYASSEYEEDGDDTASINSEKPTKPSSTHMSRSSSSNHNNNNRTSSSNSQHRKNSGSQSGTNSNRHSNSNSRAGSRSGSPVPSGSSMIAKRATSPSGGSNSGSGRKSNSGSRGNSPSGTSSSGAVKRKRVEELGDESDGSKRKRNTETPPPQSQPGSSQTQPLDDSNLITESDVIAVLRTKESFTTKDVLGHFRKAMKSDIRNKVILGGLLKSVALLEDGHLKLKPGL